MTVSPDGEGDVTITLPAATDSTDDGGICAHDDTMLCNQLVLTVSGPSQQAASTAGLDSPSRVPGAFLQPSGVGALEVLRRGAATDRSDSAGLTTLRQSIPSGC